MLAHLTGWTMPMPGPAFAAALAAMESRLRDCALSHAVDAAVAARIPVISARVSGPALAVHVIAAMHAALDEDRWLCDSKNPSGWHRPTGGRWSWTACAPCTAATPAPARIPAPPNGRRPTPAPSPAPTCASQLEAVQRWYDTDQRDQQQVRAVAYGTRPASAIEQRRRRPRRRPGLGAAARRRPQRFRDCRWPLDHLRPAAAGSPG